MSLGVNDGGEYRFGEFVFDASENTLRHDGKVLPLSPKPLDLLRLFLESQGKLLSKAELMEQLWPDSFVEESNLAVTIRQLRKALEDDAHKPVYIETIARQGYRFVAEVSRTALPAIAAPTAGRERHVRYLIPLAIAVGLIIASISLGSLYIRKGSNGAPILAAPFSAKRLSASGNVQSAVISPDGEKIVYSVRTGGREAVWLREIESDNNVEIIPASDEDYFNFEFSPDGKTIYFTRGPRTIVDEADLFSVSIFGGVPKKIVNDTRGWISVSPDGSQLSFVRCSLRDKDYCSLWMANSSDGSDQRVVVSTPSPIRIGDHEIAGNGKSIVYASGTSENSGTEFGLFRVDISTGVGKEVTADKFFDIASLELLPDEGGIIFSASRGSTRTFRVWKANFDGSPVVPLTNDSVVYRIVSLDASGRTLITTQTAYDFRLVRSSLDQLDQKQTVIEPVGRFAVDSNGSVVFQSDMSGDSEIWRSNADGSGQTQLTNLAGDDFHPIVSDATTDVYFSSNRSGTMHVWRMAGDGTNPEQITKANGGMPMFADSKWIYYQHGDDRTLWRVSTDGTTEEAVLTRRPYRGAFVFSPTGTRAAFIELRSDEPTITIISVPDGKEIAHHDLVDGKGRFELAWLQDESAIAYTLSDLEGGVNTLWTQSLDGAEPRKVADLGSEEIIFLSFPPQAETVAFVQGRWKHDLFLLSGLQ